MAYVLVIVGFAVLAVGAEVLVRGASRLAALAGISPVVIGLTVVAFGTSAPEMAVSARAALAGQGGVAIGNAIGSNIFNILLVLGASAAVAPLCINPKVARFDLHVMILTAVLAWGLVFDMSLGFIDGIILLLVLVVYNVALFIQARKGRVKVDEAPTNWPRSPLAAMAAFVAGVALLVLGARVLVDGAVEIATAWGVSETIIGLTIIAAGTSLPEGATSVMASIRGERDLAVGNVVGSNIFNMLAVLGLAGVLAPNAVAVDAGAYSFDFPIMVAISVACLPIFITGAIVSRGEGLLFLFYYLAYITLQVFQAQQHPLVDTLMNAFTFILLPVTALLLLANVAFSEHRLHRALARSSGSREGAVAKQLRRAERHVNLTLVITLGIVGGAVLLLEGPRTVLIPLALAVLGVSFAWARKTLQRMERTLRAGAETADCPEAEQEQ